MGCDGPGAGPRGTAASCSHLSWKNGLISLQHVSKIIEAIKHLTAVLNLFTAYEFLSCLPMSLLEWSLGDLFSGKALYIQTAVQVNKFVYTNGLYQIIMLFSIFPQTN